MTLSTLNEVAEYFGADIGETDEITLQNLRRSADKITECGAWAKVETKDGVLTFLCGSIVEGTDVETPVQRVMLPCEEEKIDEAIQATEDYASDIWNDTHGCDHCEFLNRRDGRPVDSVHPDCPACDGDGIPL